MQANDELFPEPDASISSSIFAVDNYELSKDYYRETFYQTIKILMKEYGLWIRIDLTFLLRQLTLSKISYIRFVKQNILNSCGMEVSFYENLDPYEALDLFISRPNCPKHDPLIFKKITCDWNLKYGEKIIPQITKLSVAYQKMAIYQLAGLYRYLEESFGEKINLADSPYPGEEMITQLTKLPVKDLDKEVDLNTEIENMSKDKFYKKRFDALYAKLLENPSDEFRADFYELIACSSRLNEFYFDNVMKGIKTTLNQNLKSKFGNQHKVEIDLHFKYLNNVVNPLQDEILQGYNALSSYSYDLKFTEEANVIQNKQEQVINNDQKTKPDAIRSELKPYQLEVNDNLALSIEFYKKTFDATLTELSDTGNENTKIAINNIRAYQKWLTRRNINFTINQTWTKFRIKLDHDLAGFITPFDYMDILIMEVKNRWEEILGVFSQNTNSSNDYYRSRLSSAALSQRKLTNLFIDDICSQVKNKYGINAYASLKNQDYEKGFTPSSIIKGLLPQEDSLSVMQEFIDSDLHFENLYHSANFYKNSIAKIAERFYAEHGNIVEDGLATILHCSCRSRLKRIMDVRQDIRATYRREVNFHYEKFFMFAEWLQFYWMYPHVLESPHTMNFYDKGQIDLIVNKFTEVLGSEIELDIKLLLFYIAQLENVLVEYMKFSLYENSGIVMENKYSIKDIVDLTSLALVAEED